MQSLSIAFLRQELRHFKLRYAFAQVRTHSLGPGTSQPQKDQQLFGVKSSISSIEIENKHQYLKYMQQVLLKKESELGQMEENLMNQKKALELQEARCKIVTPMSLAHHSEALTKKIKIFKQIMLKYVTQCPQLAIDNDFEELIDGLQLIQQSCKYNYDQIKEQLLKNHQEMAAQRQMLASKLSKLQELQSYEKYLTQLQHILEQKQSQLVSREQELKTIESSLKSSARKASLPQPQNLPQYQTFQEENGLKLQSEACVRRRTKIFQPKVTVYEASNHKQSSNIMQQTSTQHNIQPITPDSYNTLNSQTLPSQKDFSNYGVQTTERDPRIALAKQINSQAANIKILKVWLRFSANKSKNLEHSAIMHLYQWRLNAVFDEGLKKPLTGAIWWPRKFQLPDNLPFQDYGQLSLKKQKYLEHFFELELKKFQRKKVLAGLSSILKNKNRKERLAVLLCFRKYREQSALAVLQAMIKSDCSNPNYPLREVTTQHSHNTNNINLALSQNNKESRLIESSTGFIEDPLKVSTAKSKTSRKALLQSSQIKQKGKQANIDLSKLREYIKNQEETEVKLAMECAKTKAVFRLANVLKVRVGNLQQKLMIHLIRRDESIRFQEVLQAVNNYEFKWQLFMAKARLALTSNSNKVAHLQQLLSYLRTDK